jgi:hypothetical protein
VRVAVCPLSHSVTLPRSHSQALPSPAHYTAICETDGWIYWTISENVTGSMLIDRDRDQNRALWIEWLTMFEPHRPPLRRHTLTNCLVITINVSTKNCPFNKMSR